MNPVEKQIQVGQILNLVGRQHPDDALEVLDEARRIVVGPDTAAPDESRESEGAFTLGSAPLREPTVVNVYIHGAIEPTAEGLQSAIDQVVQRWTDRVIAPHGSAS
ncbi:MAG: hypothetical protein JWM87_796 [Candidatus Eremiobacteraeota bacterium]|nr:hypothetical protein [Candidatus Eremiobacteraeota bacterium]